MREKISLFFLRKEFFRIKVMYLKQKNKNQKMNQEESEEERVKKFIEYIEDESKNINYALFKDYFNFVVPSTLAKKLYEIKGKKKNNKSVNVIKSRLTDLKDKIKEMSEDDKKLNNQMKY